MKQTESKTATHAYILIRTKLNLNGFFWKRTKYRYFRECLESALRQTYENTTIIILQDDNFSIHCAPTRYNLRPRIVREIINHYEGNKQPESSNLLDIIKNIINRYKNNSDQPNPKVLVHRCNSHGAAQSLYNIRKIVCGINHKGNDNDIAILLDDDDMLASSSVVQEIVDKMDECNAQICLTQFNTIGDTSLNILNQAGRIHNDLIKAIQNNRNKHSISITQKCNIKPFGKGALCFADSLGWTKVYRIKVIKQYHEDLEGLFKKEWWPMTVLSKKDCFKDCKWFKYIQEKTTFKKYRLKQFLRKNDAFEDFPEIINLCRKDFKTTVLTTPTHKYRKHPNSITATPRQKDFKRKRPAYLRLLMKLYLALKEKGMLHTGSDYTIARYFSIKILTIENILAKFRTNCSNKRWLRNSHNGTFVQWLIDSLKKEKTLFDFKKLLKQSLLKNQIKLSVNDAPEDIIKRVCNNEVKRGIVDISHCFCDNSTHFKTRRIKNIKWRIRSFIVIIAMSICGAGCLWYYVTTHLDNGIPALSAIVAGVVAICSWAATNIYRINTERTQEDKITDMFGKAVDDLIRHIVAGYMVLHRIQQDLHRSTPIKKPAKVHFSNLKVSQQSLLMSDEFDNNIIVQEFKNLPRLRVNIRNINNSAEYMERYLDDSAYNSTHMYQIIDWEMNRYMGYFVNFMFFKENNMFRFPDETEREIFLRTHQLYNHFVEIAYKEHPNYPKLISELKLKERYEAYREDRGVNRKVLIFE